MALDLSLHGDVGEDVERLGTGRAFSIRSLVFARPAGLTSTRATLAPLLATRTAAERPRPDPAQVTMTTLSAKRFMLLHLS
jgi:hypothetical protein